MGPWGSLAYPPLCLVGIFREILQISEKLWRLPEEETHVSQKLQRRRGRPLRRCRPDNRARRKPAAQEDSRFGHDQVRLEFLAAKGGRVQVRKHQSRILR